MPDASVLTTAIRRHGLPRSFGLMVALGALLLLVAACAEEANDGGEPGASDVEDRPTVDMSDTDDDGEAANAEEENDSDVPPAHVVNTVDDAHPDGSISMIAYGQQPVAGMDALMQGELALSGECLGVEGVGDGEFVSVVWPYEYSIDSDGDVAQLLDENGEVVASEGDMVSMGGGNSPDPDGEIAELAPEDCIADSYWMSSSEVQLADEVELPGDETPTPNGDTGDNVQTEEEAIEQDAQSYADHHDVSLEEAMRRLELQQLPGPLQQELTENEADRFGGLYIEHEPEFRVVVQMTDGDEAVVRSYIDNPELDEIVEVETVEVSYQALQDASREAMNLVQDLEVMASSGVNVMENQVEIYVSDAEMLENAIADSGQELPEHVVIVGSEKEPDTLDEG